MADELELGPVDYLVIEFPGNKMTGEGFPILVDLVERGIIRILDLAFVTRGADGSVDAVDIRDFDAAGIGRLAVFHRDGQPGLLDQSDLDEIGAGTPRIERAKTSPYGAPLKNALVNALTVSLVNSAVCAESVPVAFIISICCSG